MLRPSAEPLVGSYDLAMLDLDGVVYVGPDAVPGAAAAIERARAAGMRIGFITNNASRSSSTVAAHLRDLGVAAESGDVVTSAQAAARLVVEQWGEGVRAVCLGADGLREALEDAGAVPVGVDDDAEVLVSGYGPDLAWRDIMRGATRVRDGLVWVACNTDLTIPTPFGAAPGHGVLVRMIESFASVEARVAGKPERPLLDETVRRLGARRPLMVGDRLDTDIAGAARAEIDSLLVLTGVTDLAGLVGAGPGERPTYIAADLAGLTEPHPEVEPTEAGWRAGRWTASVVDGVLRLAEGFGGTGSEVDRIRAGCAAAWQHLDATGVPVRLPDAR
ncbi:HAD-IIA family hydrolase [Nocardioides sp.]|uniref:HAD-IIA family hydrolase n=1 Tax=Nocardioides sp. TaxID=35761 RepID=UPI0035128036